MKKLKKTKNNNAGYNLYKKSNNKNKQYRSDNKIDYFNLIRISSMCNM